MLRSSLALVSLVAITGCLSPFLKSAADTPQPKPSKALLAGMLVRNPGDASLLRMAQNAGLEEFGKRATDQLQSTMAAHGYELTFDGPRTSALDAIQMHQDATTAALTGQWRHPQASYWTPQTVDSLFVKPKDMIAKLSPQDKEYFVFADVNVVDDGIILKDPRIVVRAVVYDATGKAVLDLQGLGEGESAFLFANHSPDNLNKALANAFDSVKALQEQPL
jgi:hypothetical protein